MRQRLYRAKCFCLCSIRHLKRSWYSQVCAQDLVSAALNGFNSTVLAYGQTGAGKTHTMFGELSMLLIASRPLAAG